MSFLNTYVLKVLKFYSHMHIGPITLSGFIFLTLHDRFDITIMQNCRNMCIYDHLMFLVWTY